MKTLSILTAMVLSLFTAKSHAYGGPAPVLKYYCVTNNNVPFTTGPIVWVNAEVEEEKPADLKITVQLNLTYEEKAHIIDLMKNPYILPDWMDITLPADSGAMIPGAGDQATLSFDLDYTQQSKFPGFPERLLKLGTQHITFPVTCQYHVQF